MDLLDGEFYVALSKSSEWTHVVLNYLGSNEGIQIFFDEELKESDTTKALFTESAADGRIVVGRRYTDRNRLYGSIELDELIFFNQALTVDDIETLHQSV